MTGLPDFRLLSFRLLSSGLPFSPFSLLPFFSSKKALILNYFYYLCIII